MTKPVLAAEIVKASRSLDWENCRTTNAKDRVHNEGTATRCSSHESSINSGILLFKGQIFADLAVMFLKQLLDDGVCVMRYPHDV